MDCHEFEIRLESLLEQDLEPEERVACLAHADGCAECGELLEAGRGPQPEITDPVIESMVDSVMASTVGSVCSQARQRLPEHVDRDLPPADREIIEVHLRSCSACSGLAATLTRLARELPALAEMPVGEELTQRILAATLPASIRFKRWWRSQGSNWIRRPRFAMEAAYVGLLVLLLVLGAFSTPVSALPQKSLELMQPAPDSPSLWISAREDLGTFWQRVASWFEKLEEDQPPTEESP